MAGIYPSYHINRLEINVKKNESFFDISKKSKVDKGKPFFYLKDKNLIFLSVSMAEKGQYVKFRVGD